MKLLSLPQKMGIFASLLLVFAGGSQSASAQHASIAASVITDIKIENTAAATTTTTVTAPTTTTTTSTATIPCISAKCRLPPPARPSITPPATGAAQTNVPVTFGHVFAQGDLQKSDSLIGKLSDGTSIALQVDAKATHADGSLRHAVISAVLPKLAQTQTIGLMKVAAAPGNAALATPADLLNAGFSSGVNATIGGQIYSASADALLKSGKYTNWLSGPVANEWLVSAPLKNAQGIAHPHLSARFAIRSYTGLNKAKVDVTIENNWAYEPGPQNFTYDAQVIVGGQTTYSKPALTHYHHARWRKVFWWGVAPQVHIKHNTAYLIASKAVPNYDQTVVMSSAALTNLAGFTGPKTEPMGPGIAQPYMPTTGGRPDIGLLPGWAASYLLSMDKGAKNATLGMGDLAGSWSAHYRDKNTDRPASLLDYPYMTIVGQKSDTYNPVTKKLEAFPACGGACDNPNVADTAHEPSFDYLPYIVTGDHFYLEELQFWAMWNVFQSNPGYRDNVKGLFHRTQVRGQAWILRTLADAAYITPDSDPLKPQFATLLSDNLDWYNSSYTNNPIPANSLGVIPEYIEYNNGTGLAPWQDDFFTSAVGHTLELGYAKAKPLLAWKVKFPISRMVGPDFCWIRGADYYLKVRDTPTSPIYTTIGQVYLSHMPVSFTSLPCAGAAMASALGLSVGEMTGYAYGNMGYPSNMQPALAYSVDSGSAAGANAWKIFMSRSVKPNYQDGPQFAIVPR